MSTRDVKLGPLSFPTVEGDVKETLGDVLEAVGAVVVPGERRPRPFPISLPVHGISTDGANYLAVGKMLRRQVRALIENPKARAERLWFDFLIDTDLSGWLVVGGADLSYTEQGTTFADYLLELTDCYLVGRRTTHRPARKLIARDRRLSTEPRDVLGLVRSTDFASLSALVRHWLPVGTTDLVGARGTTLPTPSAVVTADGSLALVTGRANSDVVSYEQAAVDEGRASVAIYDRKGTITAPAAAPDAAWEAVYGPAQALTAGDVPVIENARCRVRYDATNTPGFRVDVWTGAAWVEQGKVSMYRRAGPVTPVDTLVSASVVEWTPERAVLAVVMRSGIDPASRERVFITLQRGWSGPRIEIYTSPTAAGALTGASIQFQVALADANDSDVKIDSAGAGAIAATAGSGSALLGGGGNVGVATFTGENEVAILRQGAGLYTVTMAVLQVAPAAFAFSDASGYGANRNGCSIYVNSTGYSSVTFGFHAQQTDQVMEAEAMTLAAGTASVADAAASGGNAAQASRIADAIHVSKAAWPNGAKGKHRVFARLKPLTNADVINVYAKTTATTGATKTQNVNTHTWVDLGDIVADGSTLEIHAWNATAARTFNVDRVETIKLEDRTANVPAYDGARDLGQASLMDCRQCQKLLPR